MVDMPNDLGNVVLQQENFIRGIKKKSKQSGSNSVSIKVKNKTVVSVTVTMRCTGNGVASSIDFSNLKIPKAHKEVVSKMTKTTQTKSLEKGIIIYLIL